MHRKLRYIMLGTRLSPALKIACPFPHRSEPQRRCGRQEWITQHCKAPRGSIKLHACMVTSGKSIALYHTHMKLSMKLC